MSKASYIRNPYIVVTVRYTVFGKVGRYVTTMRTEEQALAEAKEQIIWSWRDDFEMVVESVVEYL